MTDTDAQNHNINTKKGSLPSERWVLYMDVLGSEHVIEQEPEKLLDLIQAFSSNSREYVVEYETEPSGMRVLKKFEPTISNFADHILISFPTANIYPLNDHTTRTVITCLIGLAAQIHYLALECGLLMRGAVTKGWQHHEGANVIGKAQLDAVRLEQKIANYPRVVISNDIAELIIKHADYTVRQDFDGVYFLDYLRHPLMLGAVMEDTFLIKLRNIIEHNLLNSAIRSDIRKLVKWQWLAIKFNEYLDFAQSKYKFMQAALNKVDKFYLTP